MPSPHFPTPYNPVCVRKVTTFTCPIVQLTKNRDQINIKADAEMLPHSLESKLFYATQSSSIRCVGLSLCCVYWIGNGGPCTCSLRREAGRLSGHYFSYGFCLHGF